MLAKGISSYQNASLSLKDGRSQEAEILTRINIELETANRDAGNNQALNNALVRNQRVWNEFIVSLAQEGHPYPDELKATLISLAIWVGKHTQQILRQDLSIEPLISLNKDIIEGLRTNNSGAEKKPSQNTEGVSTQITKNTEETRNDFPHHI